MFFFKIHKLPITKVLQKKFSLYQIHLKKLSTSPIAFKCINDKQHITIPKSKEPHEAHQQNSQT
jgi:hypothetical protein